MGPQRSRRSPTGIPKQPDESPGGLPKFTYNPRFPGQVFDKETNNHDNYFRDYDPQTGRYVQSDPTGLGGGVNTYTYALGNSVSYFDPNGRVSLVEVAGVVVIVGVAIIIQSVNRPPEAERPDFDPTAGPLKKSPNNGWRRPPPPPREPFDDRFPGADDPTGQCIALYTMCVKDRWAGVCDECLRKCTAQGEWPYGRGPGFCSSKKKGAWNLPDGSTNNVCEK